MNEAGDTPSFWERVEELFHAALDQPEEQRESFLNHESSDDPVIADRVRSLLEADHDAETVVDQRVARVFEHAVTGEEGAPERLGAYRVVEEIGRGGLATVYLAERDDEHFRKRVALKLVRRGLDTDDVLLRFRHERQILARLEHPNVARLIDGGSAPDGRPYFVMEHVDGEPIDAYCARQRFDLRRRIELFREVCAAVGYAHRNLVIHRDLKPSNILVSADGQPKLLDFGIAKLLDSEHGDPAPHTQKGMLLLTPEYASPEQVLGRAPTTQTDVYSLGVILYRLLTGVAPYSVQRQQLGELTHTICEVEPARPSSTDPSEEDLRRAGLAQDARRLRRQLRGDLDTIVLKALSKEPGQRYASVEQFSEDLRRYLEGERVLARPESFGYRAAKFVRRHRAMVGTFFTAALLLVGVVGYYTYQLRVQRDLARWQAEKAERVSSLLVGLLEISDPGRTKGEEVTAVELLGRAAGRLELELAGQPEMRAALMDLIGSIYVNLGLYDEATEQLEGALEIRRGLHEPPHAELAVVLDHLGELRYQTSNYQEAEKLLRQALTQRIDALGADHPLVGKSLNDLATVLQARGQYADAETLYRRALANQAAGAGAADREALVTRANFASLLYRTGQLEEADSLARETLERQTELLGERHPDVVLTENTLAAVLTASSKLDEAVVLLERVLARQRELYGPEHPKVAVNLSNLGVVYFYLGRLDEAEENYRQALAIQRSDPGSELVSVARTLANLADVEARGRGNHAAAAEWWRQSLELRRRIHRSAHPSVSKVLLRLGQAEAKLGEHDKAQERLREASAIHLELGPETVPEDQREIASKLKAELEATLSPRR